MDGYVRVSSVGGRAGDRFQSPDAQRDSIKGWAQAHGVRIAEWHTDLDQSGGTMDRPGMNQAMRRVREGLTDGVIVARLDRFARTVIGGLTTIKELDEHGARVVSVAESIDPATPMGKAMLGLLLIMAEWQRDQAIEHLSSAHQRAIAAGRYPGRTPHGYRRTPEGQTQPDPDTAPVIARIFRERAAGEGWRKIAAGLTRDHVPTPTGGERWAVTSLLGMIRSEAYVGVFVGPNGARVDGAWESIVTPEQWTAANAVQGTRDSSREHHDRLVAGIARCAACRGILSRDLNPDAFVSYGCNTIGCTRRTSVGAAVLDEHVSGLVDERLARLTLDARVRDDTGDTRRLLTARDQADREMVAYRDDTSLREVMGEGDWRGGLLARITERDRAELALAEHRAAGRMPGLAEIPSGTVPTLAVLDWQQRRQMVAALVHSVWVRRGTVRGPGARQHVGSRVRVVWWDDRARPDLPVRRKRSGPAVRLPPVEW